MYISLQTELIFVAQWYKFTIPKNIPHCLLQIVTEDVVIHRTGILRYLFNSVIA